MRHIGDDPSHRLRLPPPEPLILSLTGTPCGGRSTWPLVSNILTTMVTTHSLWPYLRLLTSIDWESNRVSFQLSSVTMRDPCKPSSLLMLRLLISHSAVLALTNKNSICPHSSTQGTISSPTLSWPKTMVLDLKVQLLPTQLWTGPVSPRYPKESHHQQRPETRDPFLRPPEPTLSKPRQCLEIILVKVMKGVHASGVLVLHETRNTPPRILRACKPLPQ